MNNVLTYIQVRVDCPYPIQYLTDLKITSQFNEHSQISVKGILLEEDRDKCVKTSTVNDPIRIYETNENGNDTLLFSGVVTSLNVRCESGVYYVEIKGLSYTYLMDRAFMSRSFQDINALYTEVMNQIISAYDNANFIQIPQDHHIGGLIVQYNETDWMFARRLASHFNTVLVPQDLGNGPCFWIGLHQSSEKEIEAAPNFITRNDSEAYRLIYSYGFNVRESDFMKYEIESETRLMLGDRVVFQGWPCIVERTVASFVDGLFQYKYVLGRDNGSLQPKRLNEKLRGVSLLGSVLDSQNSAVKIHLRIDDNQNTQTACWIPYAAQSNNLFYCMPEKGENISLYFQNSDESSSIAINAVRRNGGNCSKTSRPSTKYMGIPSGQEFKLGDMDINFNASDSLFFKINNDTGVQIQSPTDLTILAGQKLSFEAQGMFKVLSRSGNVLVGVGARADQSQFYFEGSAGGNANIFSSANIINDGRFKEVLTDRLNAPIEYEEKKFNFWEALGWALLAVAAVALVVFSAGTALVAMGVLATCAFPAFLATGIGLAACFAAAQMVDDYWNGETSGFLDYLKAAAQGAELGAMIVCPILALPGLAEDLDEQIQANGFWGGLKGFASEMVDGIVGFGHAWQNQITNIHDWIAYDKKFNPSDLIRLTGTTVAIIYNVCRAKDPVDVVTGAMFYTATDFEFPGPIPFTWSRTYYSDSRLVGQMGHGMRHCFEMGLDVYEEEKTLVVYLSDGRQVQFPYLQVAGNEYFSHENKILLRREIDHYALFDPKTRLMYRLELIPGGLISYKLTDISNEQGYHIQFSYDNRGHLSDIIDSVGRKMTVITNDSGQITSVLWANNLLVQYHYNEQLDLTEATDAAGKTSKMFYRDHLMVRKTDKNGGSFRWNYDYGYNVPYGRVCETFGEDGTLKGKFVYHDDKNFTEVIDALGITKYYYDERNLCTRIVYPDLTETRRVYDEQFNLVCKIDENGYPTTYTYNEWSRLLRVIQPDGATTLYSYDEKGRRNQITNPQGASRKWIYNSDGTVQQSVNEMGVPTTYAYNKNKLIESVTNVKGDTIHLAYDKNLNLSCATFPDGTSSKWEYDSCGNCLSAMNPLGAVQTYQYDALNRVVRSKLPDGNEIELEYNGYKDVIRAKDKHTEACFDYTLLGSLKSQKQGKKVVKFEYDTEERLKAVINEKGEAYQFERDVKGNITKETGFDKVTRTYERDQAGRVKRINRPGGRFTEYRYDKAGRVTQINYSDKTWDKFAYNKNGQILEATNDQGTVKFEYNAAGRIIKEWRGDHWVASEYDELGNRIQITSSLGAKILTSRDSMGRMTHVAAAEAGQSAWMGKMQYNELGQEIERSLQGDVVSKWQYDATGRPMHHHVRVEDRDMRRRRYEWGINNQLNSMTNELSKGQTAYSYDEFSNLVSSRDDCWQYLYRSADEAGNIYETDDMSDRIYGAGSRLEMSGVNTKELQNVFQGGKGKLVTRGTEYAYDVEGNLVRKTEPNGGVWQYEYFGNGMLSKVVRPDETGISFKYDSLGRRIEKATSDATKQFFWDGNKLLHESESDVIITWVFDDGFVPTAKLTNAGNYSIVSDYLGTPAEAYDENGEKVWSAELDIYGKVKDFTGDVNFIPFRYQGQYADTETGLYYNRFRYYDPVIGQYTQQDPIRLVGNNPTLYGYVFNLTVFVDPFGLDIFDVLGGTPGQPDVLSRGGCEIIAQQVQAEIGGKFLNITPNTNLIPGASYLGDVTYSQGTISGWTAHVAVVQDGIVYDAMTGPTGMPIQDYQNMFQESDVLNFETSDKITIGCGG